MFRNLLTLLLSLSVSLVLAQAEPHACGQINTPEQIAFLKANNPNLSQSFRSVMDTIFVPILFHRIADENGNGAVTEAACASALVELNALYASGNIIFKEVQSPRLIADSAFFDYQYSEEFALRQAHEVSGVINVFIPDRASSTSGGQVCGYAYLPPTRRDLTIVKASCFTNGTTLGHEVGHFLGLYHTHGTSNCGSLTDELVDGSNCETRGDDVCDTPADPNLLSIDCDRYVVDRDCDYTGTEVDANADAFAPDTRNIMSYSRQACRQHFSAGQLDRVRFFLRTTRSYLAFPTSTCASTVPTLTTTGQNFTSISIAWEDNGQDRTEIDYFVVGGQNSGSIGPGLTRTIGGLQPCDSVMYRARNHCADGSTGDWSAFSSAVTNGCGLRYCAQPGSGSETLIDALGINGTALPNLQTPENYGLHAGPLTINLDPTSPVLSIDVNIEENGNSAFFHVWVDLDNNSSFDADELIVQERVSDDVDYTFTYLTDSTVLRDVPLRARFTTSQETFIGPCDIELGETEDIDLIFQGGLAVVEWNNGPISLAANTQMLSIPISSTIEWSVTGLPNWLLAQNGLTGSPSDTALSLEVLRNEGCEVRTATLTLTGTNGMTDEIVLTQNPASPGISVSLSDTILVGPEGGDLLFSSQSMHTYEGSSRGEFIQFNERALLDSNSHSVIYSFYEGEDDRFEEITFEGCGVERSFVVHQFAGITSWVDTSAIQFTGIGDTIRLAVRSNTMWDALATSTVPWLEHVLVNRTGDGEAIYVYTGGASSGEVAEVDLLGFYGVTTGPTVVRIIAPFTSSTSSPRLSAKLIMANPISESLVATTADAKTYQWSVYSSLGQLMHASFGESLNLNTSEWPAGTFILKVEDEEGRILVERVAKF
jgi:hypothetical protein